MPVADVFYNNGSKWASSSGGLTVPTTPPTVDPTGWDSRVRKPQTLAQLPYPVYDVETLRQGTDTTLSAIASHIPTAGGYLRFPPGEYPIKAAPDLTYPGEYHQKMLGWIGDEAAWGTPNQTVIRLSNSPTAKYMEHAIRFGHESHGANNTAFLQDISIIGSRRAALYDTSSKPKCPSDPGAALVSGIMLYYTNKATLNRVKLRGLCYGAGNAPETGETSNLTNLHGTDTLFVDADIDGRDEAGTRVSSGMGGGGSGASITFYRSHFHDTAVSGWSNTFSGAYGKDIGSPGGPVTVIDSRIGNVANWHGWSNPYSFSFGANAEGNKGPQTFDRVSLYHDLVTASAPQGQKPDFSFTTQYTDMDMSPITIRDVTFPGRPTLIVQYPYSWSGVRNYQKAAPLVYRAGVQLQPFVWRGVVTFGADMKAQGFDPAKHYVLFWLSAPAGETFPGNY